MDSFKVPISKDMFPKRDAFNWVYNVYLSPEQVAILNAALWFQWFKQEVYCDAHMSLPQYTATIPKGIGMMEQIERTTTKPYKTLTKGELRDILVQNKRTRDKRC